MEYRTVLEKTLGHALNYIEKLDTVPVGATASIGELRERLLLPLNEEGIDGEQVIDELVPRKYSSTLISLKFPVWSNYSADLILYVLRWIDWLATVPQNGSLFSENIYHICHIGRQTEIS